MTPFFSLLAREVHRFLKLWMDTVLSPIASTILFLAIFSIIMADQRVEGLPYATFIYTGLLAMNVLTSSFSNPGFALVIARNIGTFIDLQVTPLRAFEIGLAYALAGAARALVILVLVTLVTAWWVPDMTVLHPLTLALALLISGVQFGMLGVIFGMLAKRFEALPFITSFILQPMTFLGGVFYPVSKLPDFWAVVSQWNPLFHNINLIRYGFVGYTDAAIATSWAVLLGSLVPIFIVMHVILKRRLRE